MREMTKENLKAAFAGESQAYMKYVIFADRAEEEGYPEVARLFRAIAFAERVHATNHLRELGDIGDTVANLEVAIGGENYENTEMYPAFNAVAKLQEEKGAMHCSLAFFAQMWGDDLTGNLLDIQTRQSGSADSSRRGKIAFRLEQ